MKPSNRRNFPGKLSDGLAGLSNFLVQPEAADEGRLRLLVAGLLAAGGIFYFRAAALWPLVLSVFVAAGVMALVWASFHRLGWRAAGDLWPGMERGFTLALLAVCVSPPGLPLAIVALMVVVAVVVEGRLRKVSVPLALPGVLIAWLIGWAWHAHAGAPFVRPFDLRVLDEPLQILARSQVELDPIRLYTGNVPGLLGATSFGLAAIGFLLLAYARRASLGYLGGFALPLVLAAAASHQSLPVHLVEGSLLVAAGIIGSETRRLPRQRAWRVGAGVAAGAIAAQLQARGLGIESFPAAVLVVGIGLSLLQAFGMAGSPGVVSSRPIAAHSVPQVKPAHASTLPLAAEVAALVLFLPLGLGLVAGDTALSRREKTALGLVGGGLYLAAGVFAVAWTMALRLPS